MATRRERVVVEVESDLAATAVRDAVAVALLKRELRSLSGQAVTVSRTTRSVASDTDRVGTSASKADASINKLTGRLRVMADVAAILGPALGPIGGVGIAGIAGLANQFGVAALAAGAAIISFQGVGDALKAVNTAALEPTTANLEAARLAMERLSPASRDMVRELQSLRPMLEGLRDAGAEGLFPGVLDALDSLETRAPDVERIVGSLARTLGELTRDAGADLASRDWDQFFKFLATDAADTLSAMGRATGSLAHGMAELWMAFDPLNDDFSHWVEDVAHGFDGWATGLDHTEGFTEFLDYVRSTGPQVEDTVVALANAVLQIVEASAPLGGPVLHALESVANIVASIADSDLGTPIMTALTAMALLNRAQGTYRSLTATTWGSTARGNVLGMASAITTVTSAQDRARMSARQLMLAEEKRAASIRAGLGTIAKGAGALAALTLASTGAADSIGLSNTAVYGLVGGPWGAAVGLTLDLADATGDLSKAVDEANDAMKSGAVDQMRAKYKQLADEIDASDIKSSLLAQFDFSGQLDRLKSGDFGGLLKAGPIGSLVNAIRGQSGEAISTLEELKRAIYNATHVDTGRGLGQTLAPNLGVLAAGFDSATESAQDFRESMAKVSAALDGRANLRDFKAAIDDYRHSLDKATKSGKDFLNQNKDGFRTSTNLGREMEAALDAIANSSLGAAESMKGMARTRFLDQARDQFINAARAAGLTKQAARDLADELGLVDRITAKPKVEAEGIPETHHDLDGVNSHFKAIDSWNATPKVTVDTGPAAAAIANIRSWLFNIPDEHVNVLVNRIGGVTSSYGGHSADAAGANGITVPGARYPYRDKILMYLAPGEEVISNRHGQADRHRQLLKAINGNRMADGGTAMSRAIRSPHVNVSTSTGPLTASLVLSDQDVQRIAVAVREGATAGMGKAMGALEQALGAEMRI